MPPLGPGFATGMSGGGGDLGKAHGSITLDVSDLLNAERVSKSVGQNIQKNLSGIGTATDATATKMGGLGQAIDNTSGRFGGLGRAASSVVADIRTLRTEIAAVGAASALITVFGLKASNEIRVARIRLSQFVQTEEEANALMRQLADSAGEFGLEIGGVFALAGTLLPLLEGNVEATAEWVERAARLRAVLPTAQQGAEVRAISEYLSGQTISLQRLFNIPPNIILEAKAQFEDAGRQIDYILQRMGATEESARAMADPLVSIKNELKLIAAVGFDPILQKIREILPEFRVWLENIRETHPEILGIGAALVTAAAVGAPLLLLATQVLGTLQKIKALGIIAPLGKAGLVGAAAVGGFALAGELVRGVGRATGDDRAANLSNFDVVREALKSVVDIFLGFMGLLGPAFQAIISELTRFASMLTGIFTIYGQILTRLGELIPEQFGGKELTTAGNIIQDAGEEAGLFVKNLAEANENVLPEYMRRLTETRDAFGSLIDRLFNVGGSADIPAPMGGGLLTGGAGTLTELQQSQIAAWEEYQEAIIAIESRSQGLRLKITQQYEEQRTRIIAQYEKTIAREAEDFARQRARAAAELASDIQAIRDGQIEDEAEWQQELNETIAELREDSIKRIADIEEQANRQREQMERDHRLTLLEAAGRLDARAVANEQRRFKSQVTTFDRELAERIQKERDNLAERIAQEEKAYEKRIAAERENNEERIAALIEAQEERQALEDEDRAIRLERMKQDHLAQLAELETANNKRLAELKTQGNKELLELRSQFEKQNLELTGFYDQWLATQAAEQANSLAEWDAFWKSWKDLQDAAMGGAGGGTAGGGTGGGTGGTGGGGTLPTRRELELIATNQAVLAGWTQGAIFSMMSMIRDWDDKRLALWIEKTFNYDVPGYRQGTMNVPNTGPAILHKGEAVLDATTAGWLRRMFSVNSGPQFAGAGASSRMNVGGINIYAAPGQSVQDIGREVEKRMMKLFKGMG